MMRTLQVTNRFRQDLAGLPRQVRAMAYDAAQLLRHDPLTPHLEAKRLRRVPGILYRARLGEYRLVYSFTPKTILLRTIAHRRTVYRHL